MTTQDCLVNVFPRICCQLKQSEYAVAGFYNDNPMLKLYLESILESYFDPDLETFLLKSQIFSTEVCKLIADWRDKVTRRPSVRK